jgi:hypothetical protein
MEEKTKEKKFELVTVKRLKNNEKYGEAVMTVFYEDGIKKVAIDENPTIRFHTTKISEIDKYKGKSLIVIPEEDTEEIECPISETFDQIVALQHDFDSEEADKNMAYITRCRAAKMRPENLLLLNHVHGIDADLTDHYIGRFLREHEKDIETKNIRKGFFDIEANGRAHRGFVPASEHSIPVNAISFLDQHTATLVLRLLDDEGPDFVEKNPLIQKFKDNIEENRLKIEDHVNNLQKKIFKDMKLKPIKVEIVFYKDEVKLISDHYISLRERFGIDYLMAFNQEYDLRFSFGRLKDKKSYKYLCDVVSDPSVPEKYRSAWYEGDFNAIDVSKRNDRFSISSPWSCQDQQYSYFKIRESQQKMEEYNLDFVLKTALKIQKVEHDCEIADFPYEDYENFVLYSAIDTCGLYWLETKTQDIDTMILLGNLSRTRTEKSLTKTIMLRNFIEYFFRDQCKLILSNNRVRIINNMKRKAEEKGEKFIDEPELEEFIDGALSILEKSMDTTEDDDDDDEDSTEKDSLNTEEKEEETDKIKKSGGKIKFRGAFVASPLLMDNVGKEIMGKLSSLIFEMVCDSDLSSLYPNIKKAWNIFVGTLVGKIYPKSNVLDINFSAEMADYLVSRNDMAIGKKYFDLPDQTELMKFFEECQKEIIVEENYGQKAEIA